MSGPDFADLCKLLSYDPRTGAITWRTARGPRRCGDEAGYIDRHGYRRVCVLGRKLYSHHIAFALSVGAWPSERIDHRNGDRQDNRAENLRPASQSENIANARTRSDNSSGVKGVYWHRASKKWLAQIKIQGKRHYLGVFENIDAAAAAYKSAAMSAFGEFARLR